VPIVAPNIKANMSVFKQVYQKPADPAVVPQWDVHFNQETKRTALINQSLRVFFIGQGKCALEQWRGIHHIYSNYISHDYTCHHMETNVGLMGKAQYDSEFRNGKAPAVIKLQSNYTLNKMLCLIKFDQEFLNAPFRENAFFMLSFAI